MSILIKGMEMPKGCATCPYCDRAWNKPKCKAKSAQGRFMEQRLNLDRTRQKWCPLVPVPPHGRLIDADELAKEIEYARFHHSHTDGLAARHHVAEYGHFLKALSEFPTIIPADPAEEEE